MDYSDINKYSYSVNKDVLINQQFSKSSPYTRAFLLLLAQNEPSNLVNGNKIDLGNVLSKYNLKEYHLYKFTKTTCASLFSLLTSN
jgi:hypothetical protein